MAGAPQTVASLFIGSATLWGALTPPLFGLHQLLNIDQLGGVVAGVAGVAVFVALVVHRLPQRGERKIAQESALDEAPDLLHRVVGGDQLPLGRACPRRRSTGTSWAGRRCACAPRARPPAAPCARSCGWWCRARSSRPPAPRACPPAATGPGSASASRRNRGSPALGSMNVRPDVVVADQPVAERDAGSRPSSRWPRPRPSRAPARPRRPRPGAPAPAAVPAFRGDCCTGRPKTIESGREK